MSWTVACFGGGGRDELYGGENLDVLTDGDREDAAGDGTPGPDLLDGGPGRDKLGYARRMTAVRVDIGGREVGGRHDEGDVVRGIEDVTGGAGDDRLVGSDRVNDLVGGAGRDVLIAIGGGDRGSSDTLSGGPDSDRLSGGDGPDLLRGGPGADRLYAAGDATSSGSLLVANCSAERARRCASSLAATIPSRPRCPPTRGPSAAVPSGFSSRARGFRTLTVAAPAAACSRSVKLRLRGGSSAADAWLMTGRTRTSPSGSR